MKSITYLFLPLLLLSLLISCSKENKATVQFWLTDAPGDYEKVLVDIQGLEVNPEEINSGWQSVQINTGVYDLLELTNGIEILLGESELPVGKVSQLRLILGGNNTLQIDNQEFELSTPSGQQTGLKIQVHQVLQEGITYKVLLDFDAAMSVVKAGASGKYLLKPVIRSITEAQDGAIRGSVLPVESTPAVYVISGLDTLASSFSDKITGKFLVRGIAPGTYTVSFSPSTGFQSTQVENVIVSLGVVTDLATITIPNN